MTGPQISFVVPVVERRGDLRTLFNEFVAEIEKTGRALEVIFVVDSRQSDALPILRELQEESAHEVTLIALGGNFGESAALTVGFENARGEIVITAAAYFQVEPSGVAQAVDELDNGADFVIGRRFPRKDSFFNRAQSRLFHWLLSVLTGSSFGDISCGFRAMRRQVLEEIRVYGGLHRFLPVLALRSGFKVIEIKLPQRHEDLKTRYYGVALYLKRLLDILTVFFLLKFTGRPLRFFGLLGLIVTAVGGVITCYLGVMRLFGFALADRPMLLFGVLLIVLGIQTLSIGLIGELIIFTHAREVQQYRVIEIVQGGKREPSKMRSPAH